MTNAQEVLIYNKKIKELLPDLQIYLSLKTSPERDEKAAASSGFVCPLLQTNSSFYLLDIKHQWTSPGQISKPPPKRKSQLQRIY